MPSGYSLKNKNLTCIFFYCVRLNKIIFLNLSIYSIRKVVGKANIYHRHFLAYARK